MVEGKRVGRLTGAVILNILFEYFAENRTQRVQMFIEK
jgi:hypothetical protein